MNTDEFIAKAIRIHGDQYDYSKSVYHYRHPITITCKKHGDFAQRYDHHIGSRMSGCRKCYNESLMSGDEEIMTRMINIHHGRYKYPSFNYTGMRGYIDITCSSHGVFRQSISSHLKGRGCVKCAKEDHLQSVADEFVRKSKLVHGDIYDYSKSLYTGSNTWLTITCREHGDFEKTPDNHIHRSNPQGCPKCAEYFGYRNELPGYLYLFSSDDGKFVKVGISNKPRKRIKKLKKTTPFGFSVTHIKKFENGAEAREWERMFHNNFTRAGLSCFDGCTEWMLWDDNIIKWFRFLKH